MSAKPFRLSSTLVGHSQDVKALASSTSAKNPILISSSRDSTARTWVLEGGSGQGKGWRQENVYKVEEGGQGFVNAVGFFEERSGGRSYVLSAGQDGMIYGWDHPSLSPTSPSRLLIGHASNVCALSVGGEVIVSGSWDCSAIVWRDWQISHRLLGHTASVWAVLVISDGTPGQEEVLTGAADNLIKLWRGSKEVRTFKRHSQAVRSLVRLPSLGDDVFASAANDGSIRIWKLSGESIGVLSGHDSFVYSLSALDGGSGGLVSGGEDRTVRVWNEKGDLEQTITLPAISVWSVHALPNGDIAAGSSDSSVRVFTRDDSRVADAETLREFEELVAGQALNKAQVGDVKQTDLPGLEALSKPGQKEGQVIMVKNGVSVEAHQWNASSGTWQKIGEVVDSVGQGQGRKQVHEGKEWDYVFDVDIKDGAPPLKLPYNVTESPYIAAERFLLANDLPSTYVEEIVQFIDKNTGGTTITTSNNDYVDPFTGASRYIPAGEGQASQPSAPTRSLLPHRAFIPFTQANLPAVRSKIVQFNNDLQADPSVSSKALPQEDIPGLDKVIAAISPTVAKTDSTLPPLETSVMLKLLAWPSDKIFPVLDLTRLVVAHFKFPQAIPLVMSSLDVSPTTPQKEQETNSMLALRVLANAFVAEGGSEVMKSNADEVIDYLTIRGTGGLNKNGRLALATVLLHLSILAVHRDLEPASASKVLELAATILQDQDSEVTYRSLFAIGNILVSPSVAGKLSVGPVQTARGLVADVGKRAKEDRIRILVGDIERV